MKNKGFTLIEIVVALAIMIIIFGFAYPSLAERDRANEINECKKTEEVVNKAINLCYALEGSYPPVTWTDPTDTPPERDCIDYMIEKGYLVSFDKEKYIVDVANKYNHSYKQGEFKLWVK